MVQIFFGQLILISAIFDGTILLPNITNKNSRNFLDISKEFRESKFCLHFCSTVTEIILNVIVKLKKRIQFRIFVFGLISILSTLVKFYWFLTDFFWLKSTNSIHEFCFNSPNFQTLILNFQNLICLLFLGWDWEYCS